MKRVERVSFVQINVVLGIRQTLGISFRQRLCDDQDALQGRLPRTREECELPER